MQRWFALFGVKPHLAKTFKLSTDPFFIEKVRDINYRVGVEYQAVRSQALGCINGPSGAGKTEIPA